MKRDISLIPKGGIEMRRYRIFITIIACIAACVGMTACGGQAKADHPVSAAIIVGDHANSKKPNCDSPEVQALIDKVTSSYGLICAIRNDGNPRVQWSIQINKPSGGLGKAKLEQIATMQSKELGQALTLVKANNPEVDTFAALVMAVRSLASAPAGSEKQIYVLDSCLPTTGILNYTASNFVEADPELIANYLSEREELPDLTGITVTFIGIGDVAYPQKDLSGQQKNNLIETWKQIVEKAGGSAVVLDTLPGDDCLTAGYPSVTTVILPNADVASLFTDEAAAVFSPIKFVGDTAEFVNKTDAKKTLDPVARYMNEHPEFSLLLIGTTATGDDEFCKKLSYARVEAVRTLLSSMGANSDRIKVAGFGYHDIWHIPDVNESGNLIESAASQNRKVVLMNLISPEAKEIISEL
jgi:outer membrane protein OmpA-like peptidoglycan-associated protein